MSLNAPEQNIEQVEKKIEQIRIRDENKSEVVFLDDLLEQANSKPVIQGDLFANVTLIYPNVENTQTKSNMVSHNETKVENMDGFGKQFSQEEIEKIKSEIDKKSQEQEKNQNQKSNSHFGLSQIDDKSLFALMQDQGISSEKTKIFENKENIVHLLTTFADIDNENRINSKENKKLYPASPEEGNSLSLKEGGVMRYDVAGYVRGYEEFFKSPKQAIEKVQEAQTKVENVKTTKPNHDENNYSDFMQKIKEEKAKEQSFGKTGQEIENDDNLSQVLGRTNFVHM